MKWTRMVLVVGAVVAMATAGCGDNDNDGDLDENGVFDMTAETVGQMLGAIQTECAESGTSGGGFGALTPSECRDACDCGVRAVAELESRTEAPELTDACYAACDPDFDGTNDLKVSSFDDDANDESEFDEFFLAYIVKCDEVANRQIREDRDLIKECIDTCNCLSDTMEKYISRSEDDDIRESCDDQCESAFEDAQRSGPGNAMVSFLQGR